MKEEKKELFGFGLNDEKIFDISFETVEELIDFAVQEWDAQNSDYFNEDDENAILIGHVKYLSPRDCAPSLDDIAETMQNIFYDNYCTEDCGDVEYENKPEVLAEFHAFLDKYFDLPCTMCGYADIGWYDVKERRWIEKFEKKED